MKSLVPGPQLSSPASQDIPTEVIQPQACVGNASPFPTLETGPSDALSSAILSAAVGDHLRTFMQLEEQTPILATIAKRMVETLRTGGKILFCGNGGSAADAQHLAAELVGKFRQPRRGLAAIALTTDSSVLTSIANDFGYREIFRRQIEALGMPGDLLIGLSTSGESENVCAAMVEARRMGMHSVAMVGGTGGRLADLADTLLCVASGVTARVQEAHLFCGHVLCEMVECALLEADWMTRFLEDQQAGLPFDSTQPLEPTTPLDSPMGAGPLASRANENLHLLPNLSSS